TQFTGMASGSGIRKEGSINYLLIENGDGEQITPPSFRQRSPGCSSAEMIAQAMAKQLFSYPALSSKMAKMSK
ncbi:MAG: hypothetical protein MUO63_17900, partial [Desulfobulbaceae bacterium]|nr:hypothetical protein [Desulfobulbaceae bacterium]